MAYLKKQAEKGLTLAELAIYNFIITGMPWERRPELGKGLLVTIYILIVMAWLGYCAAGCEVTIEG